MAKIKKYFWYEYFIFVLIISIEFIKKVNNVLF